MSDYSNEDISSIEQNEYEDYDAGDLEDIQFAPKDLRKKPIKEESDDDDQSMKENTKQQKGIRFTKPVEIVQKSVMFDKTAKTLNTVESRPTTAYKPQNRTSYGSFLQQNKKYNFQAKTFNTLQKKSDPVARYQQMSQQWNQSKFLKSTKGGTKEGRKLKLDERIEQQKQAQRDEGIFHRYITKSQLFI